LSQNQSKKKQAKLLLLGMAGAGVLGLYLWWKNRPPTEEVLGELVTGGGAGAFLPAFEFEPSDPLTPVEPIPTPTPETEPIIIQMGGGGNGGYMPPTPAPTPEAKTFLEEIFPTSPIPTTPSPFITPTPEPAPVTPTTRPPVNFLEVIKGGLRTLPFTKYGFQLIELALDPKGVAERFTQRFGFGEIPTVQATPSAQVTPSTQVYRPQTLGYMPQILRPRTITKTLGFMPSMLKPSWMSPTSTPQPTTIKAQTPYTPYRSGQAWLM
jgi:hypothetical protein